MTVHEVASAALSSYRDLFRGPQPEFVVASVLDGNTAAQVWVAEQTDGPDCVLLWDQGNNVFYLAGQPVSAAVQHDLAQLISGQVRALASAAGRSRFKVRPLTPEIEQVMPTLFDGIALRELQECLLRFEQPQPPIVPAPHVAELRFALIDRAFLARDDWQNNEYVRDEIGGMWSSSAQFDRYGFGYAALVGDEIICWCTAEYVSSGACGIGIATVPAYEGRGVATATAAQFVAESLRRGLTPYWECVCANQGSLRVAQKAGFTQIETPQFWLGMFTT